MIRMIGGFTLLALVTGSSAQVIASLDASLAAPVRAGEAEVRAMPMLERPNRIGHVYGNNVRRLRHGRLCVNCGFAERPVRRFLYLP